METRSATRRNRSSFDFTVRQRSFATMVGVTVSRGGISMASSEKVIPPVISYNTKGEINYITVQDILKELKFHPYKPMSKDFNKDRLADTEVFSFYQQLEHFPTLPTTVIDGKKVPHPIAEFIYSTIMYLKPDESITELRRKGFHQYSQEFPRVLDRVIKQIKTKYNQNIDPFSVPKKEVGSFVYSADEDGVAWVSKAFSFGLHRLIPTDRIAREVSSLKAAERFLTPIHGNFELNTFLKPYVTTLRIAVVGTEESMLDSGDLYPSALPKIACRLETTNIVGDVRSIPERERKLSLKPFRGGLELIHQETKIVDETQIKPGATKLVLPGGVKFVCQLQEDQAVDQEGKPVDLLLDFRTLAAKGAAALFVFDETNDKPTPVNLEELKALFYSLKQRTIRYLGQTYQGYIIECPVMRPGLRYTENSKPSHQVSVDLISKAIMQWDYDVPNKIEQEYRALRELREGLRAEKDLRHYRPTVEAEVAKR